MKAESECSAALQQDCSGYREMLTPVKSALDVNLDEKVNHVSLDNAEPQYHKAGSGRGGKTRRFTKRTYLKAVEEKFQDNRKKYHEIKDIEANRIEISDAKSRV
ncbi:hypothetical protein MKW98_019113 [Papaver atlanticum]|uniref:Uncharacterized protein n=1 Tax=Papaver atlanticum TaxID=357466 RepID=A0AAD4XZB1_9MAGN|nr:hypothetical protein MKW98_019113 [Papaver atlanticum]